MRDHALLAALTRVAFLTLLLTACGGLNPRQELVYDADKACWQEGAATFEGPIGLDGSFRLIGREGEIHKRRNCIIRYLEQAEREGRVPPRPPSLKIALAKTPPPGALVVPQPPAWSKGDEWRFSIESPAGRQTYTRRVDREETLDGVAHYVIKSGTRETFYRKSDLASVQEIQNGVVVARSTPPRLYYVWPLAVGATWEQTYHFERPKDGKSFDTTYSGSVEGEETLTVPAGTFRTLRVVYRNKPDGTINWEQWYAPEARMWVRLREPLKDGVRIRELIAFAPAQ
jgi:hypothetical protein